MNINDLGIIRHEVLLAAVILLTVILSIFSSWNRLARSLPLLLFIIVVAAGVAPGQEGFLFNGNFISSPLVKAMKNILNAAILIIMLQVAGNKRESEKDDNMIRVCLAMFVSLLGLYIMLSSGSLPVFYAGLEISALPFLIIFLISSRERSLRRMTIIRISLYTVASILVISGILLIFKASGSVLFSELIKKNMNTPDNLAGLIIMFTGMTIKAGVTPFLIPDNGFSRRMQISLLSYLTVVLMGGMFFILTILLYSVFPSLHIFWQKSILIISILMITGGNILLFFQKSIRGFLVSSSFLQAGYILAGLIGANRFGMESMIYAVICYVFSALAVTGVISIFYDRTGKERISDFKGIYGVNPRFGLLLGIGLLSLAGIPPLAGFFGRFFLFLAAAEQNFYFLVLVASLNMVFSLYCYSRFAGTLFRGTGDKHEEVITSTPSSIAWMIICLAGILLSGAAGFIFDYLRTISFGVL